MTFIFSFFACLSDMTFRLYRDITCPRSTFSFKKRPCPAFGILDRRIETSGNRMHFENFAGSPASGKSLIRRAFATYTSPSGEKRGGGRLMRMVLMVDAQNIVSVFTVQRGNYQIQAKKFSIGNEQHLWSCHSHLIWISRFEFYFIDKNSNSKI